jgi:hypothetical protein
LALTGSIVVGWVVAVGWVVVGWVVVGWVVVGWVVVVGWAEEHRVACMHSAQQ